MNPNTQKTPRRHPQRLHQTNEQIPRLLLRFTLTQRIQLRILHNLHRNRHQIPPRRHRRRLLRQTRNHVHKEKPLPNRIHGIRQTTMDTTSLRKTTSRST